MTDHQLEAHIKQLMAIKQDLENKPHKVASLLQRLLNELITYNKHK